MIKTFKHRGLEAFFKTGDKAGIQVHHAAKLRVLLTALNAATGPQDMGAAAWKLHPLKGALKGHWSVWVNGNYRLTFKFVGKDAEVVDYQDYH